MSIRGRIAKLEANVEPSRPAECGTCSAWPAGIECLFDGLPGYEPTPWHEYRSCPDCGRPRPRFDMARLLTGGYR